MKRDKSWCFYVLYIAITLLINIEIANGESFYPPFGPVSPDLSFVNIQTMTFGAYAILPMYEEIFKRPWIP
jgi:hypothetical protein